MYVVRGRVFRSSSSSVIPLLRLQLRDPAVGIVQVAEDNRIRRASLLARGHHFAVAQSRGFLFPRAMRPWVMRCTQ